jgi:hypothetical protein
MVVLMAFFCLFVPQPASPDERSFGVLRRASHLFLFALPYAKDADGCTPLIPTAVETLQMRTKIIVTFSNFKCGTFIEEQKLSPIIILVLERGGYSDLLRRSLRRFSTKNMLCPFASEKVIPRGHCEF